MLDPMEISFELITMLDKPVLFIDSRINKDLVPSGLYVYDLRETDDGGRAGEIKEHIMVNHYGTIICKEPIELSDGDCKFITEDDYGFEGEDMTLLDYMAREF